MKIHNQNQGTTDYIAFLLNRRRFNIIKMSRFIDQKYHKAPDFRLTININLELCEVQV